jgi:hypothetical protein
MVSSGMLRRVAPCEEILFLRSVRRLLLKLALFLVHRFVSP